MSDLTKEQIENRKEWIESLRSGEYDQGNEALATTYPGSDDEPNFCCLGVYCAMQGTPNEVMHFRHWPEEVGVDIEKKVGIVEFEIEFLAELNDHGVPFTGIADVIQSDFDPDVIKAVVEMFDVKESLSKSAFAWLEEE